MNEFTRFLAIVLAVSCSVSHCCAQQTRRSGDVGRPAVGAIRWDAWFGQRNTVGEAVHRTLGPGKWHYRLPFYARAAGDEQIEIDGSSQVVVDREIEYAAEARLDYWAFVTYSEDDPLSLGLKRFLSSPVRSRLGFCLITECERWLDAAFVSRVARLMREPGYQRVAGGRPLLYVGFVDDNKLKNLGGAEGFRRILDKLRTDVAAGVLPSPYLVLLDFHPPRGRERAEALGCDAISSYAVPARAPAEDYAELAANTEKFWEACKATGGQVVPIVMTGWDRRPRVERPVPWEKNQRSAQHIEAYARPGTPAQIAGHLRSAVDWVRTHRKHAAPQTVLIYAWNEFDEGGWLTPTLSEGAARLDAIQRVLEPAPSSQSTGG